MTKPILLDETGTKILAAIQRIKNKILGTSSDPITPGSAGASGVKPVMQDDTGRDIISALNDLGDAMPSFPLSVSNGGTGSATQNFVDLTTEQNIEGLKRFNSAGVIVSNLKTESTTPPVIQFNVKAANGDDDYPSAAIRFIYSTIAGYGIPSCMMFREYSYNSSTGAMTTSGYENFRLPNVNPDRSNYDTYYIVTTKGLTTATLASGSWSSNTQTVTVTGVTASNSVIVSPDPASYAAYTAAGIHCSSQGANSLTFTCTTVPTSAITVNVLIMG